MPELSISLLGPFQVSLDSQPITAFRSDKERALLAYLAVEADRPHRREALAALLWGELPEEAALNNVRKALHRLRQVLQDDGAETPFLITTPKTIQFNQASHYELDTASFTRHLVQTQAHPHRRLNACQTCHTALEAAAGRYRGDLLHGFTLPDCMAFDEWLLIAREQLRLRALDVFHNLASYYERRGLLDRVQYYALRLLELDPLREAAHRQIMLALARAGQRTAALARYETCRRLLASELAVEPEPETVALYEKIKRADSAGLAAPAHHNLPAPTTPFFGRETDSTRLRTWLENPAYRLITLVGPGGVGKTRLSLQVASNLLADFEDGIYFVSLASIRDAGLVAGAIGRALGLRESASQDIEEATKNFLRTKEILLVLDNFEHVLEAVVVVADLLASSPRLTVLATSREALRLSGEQEYPVPPLALPTLRAESLDNLLTYGAVSLFVQRAQAVSPDFTLDLNNAAAIASICRRLDGLPLAIELAAARIRNYTPEQLLTQFETASAALPSLTGGARDLPVRQQTMRSAIAWSYDLLDTNEQRLFWKMGVFVGGAALVAVEAVCQSEAGPLLKSLVDQGLALSVTIDNEQRFTMLETIREYAVEQLAVSDEAYALCARHAQYVLEQVGQASPELTGPDQNAWLNRLEREHANIRAALGWALANDQNEIAYGIGGLLWRFWDMHGHATEGRRWLTAIMAQPSDGVSHLAQARAANGAGMMAWYQGDYTTARRHLSASLELYRQLNDLGGQAVALNNLGMVSWGQGDYEAAYRLYTDCLAMDTAADDKMGMAYSHGNLGLVIHHQGNFIQARDHFGQSLAIFKELGNTRHEAFALHNLAMTVYHQNQYDEARSLFEASLKIKETLGDKWGIASTMVYLANITRNAVNLPKTHELLTTSLNLRIEISDISGLADSLDGFAALAVAEKNYDRAARLFGAAETIRESSNSFLHATDRIERDRSVAVLRNCFDNTKIDSHWAAGREMSLTRAVDYALGR